MNFQFCYKGQIVSVHSNETANIRKLYDTSVQKFKSHLSQELVLYGSHVRLRIKRNNIYLEWKDLANSVLIDNEMIIIEPNNYIFKNSTCHAPRHDKSSMENNFSGVQLNKSVTNSPVKNNKIPPEPPTSSSQVHSYYGMKVDKKLTKENHSFTRNFDRYNLRRSLGAGIAPQFDMPSLKKHVFGSNRDNSYQKDFHSPNSSISDTFPKREIDCKMRIHGTPSKSTAFDKVFPKSAPASPSKPVPPLRSPHTHLSMMNDQNVRTIGKKINIIIFKKPIIGLGFTIVTRDNQVVYGSGADIANSVVILVKKILENGGAADEGRLQPGDRLLEVNSVPVTSLKDATDKLRAIPENTTVELLISRIENDGSKTDVRSSKVLNNLPQLTFEIILNSKQKLSEQLGLIMHYRNEKDYPPLGPGIYIHSILSQSLVAKQGGLQINDKLVGVNGQSLADLDVEATITLLKTALQNNEVLAITVIREPINQSLHQTDSVAKNSIPNLTIGITLKSDPNYVILPGKLSMDNKSKKPKIKHYNNNNDRYSSSESCSQYDADMRNSPNSNAFKREGNGRRSMSEKRKFHQNPANYEIYRNIKDNNSRSSERLHTTDRAYSTLPNSSHKKILHEDISPPPLPNKTPTRPSKIKIKAQESGQRLINGTPNRSSSLRSDKAQKFRSPKSYSQTPTHELPVFNREMNNSFKKAVQSSNEHKKTSHSVSHTAGKQYGNSVQTTQSEEEYQNFNQVSSKHPSNSSHIPRSNSVKNTVKKKSFNIKDFLTFTPNVNQIVKYNISAKSDTFPPDKLLDPQLPNYQSVNINDSKHRPYSPIELPPEFQYCNDQAIIDSAKRVLEWQKKNSDVISKENKLKDNKVYQPIGSHISCDSRIQKAKVDVNFRNSNTNRNSNQYHYETDPYETLEGTLSSPIGQSKPKNSRSHTRSVNNTIYGVTGALATTKNGEAGRSNSIIPYQTVNSNRKVTSISNEIYATVNKQPIKRETSNKQSSNISQVHKNKYKF